MPTTGLTSPTHLMLLLLIGLILFGGKRLPEIGRSLGSGLREFRDSLARSQAPRGPTDDALNDSAGLRPEAGAQTEPRDYAARSSER